MSHYLFEPCFARPGEGHDKGSVESRGKGIRLAHMSPVPQGRTLEEIARGRAGFGRRGTRQPCAVAGGAGGSARAAADRVRGKEAQDRAGVAPGDGAVGWCDLLGSLAVEEPPGPCPASVRATSSSPVATRSTAAPWCGRDSAWCVTAHYFEELSRKPQAVRQVAPELLAELGPAYRKLWRMLELRHGALETARLFAKLLSVVTDHGSEEVAAALEEALTAGRFDLLGLALRSPASKIEVPEPLRRHDIESARAADFDVLLQEAAS